MVTMMIVHMIVLDELVLIDPMRLMLHHLWMQPMRYSTIVKDCMEHVMVLMMMLMMMCL
jgi:hypothetical protein